LPLEDPASEERGYGPVCAKKDTHLYARTITANYPMALGFLFGVEADQLPEGCPEVFQGIKEAVQRCSVRAACRTDDGDAHFSLDGEDLRPIIKKLDWLLSFKMDEKNRALLVTVVKHLGYSSLAAVLSLEASTSKAPVWFKDGYLFLKGATCKQGFLTMKKIPGIRLPSRRKSGEPFVAHASQAKAFLDAVQSYWPFYVVSDHNEQPVPDGTIDSLLQEAQEWLAKNPPDVPSSGDASLANGADRRPLVIMRTSNGWTTFLFPWINGMNTAMYAIIAKIKEIPLQSRKFNPGTKEWSVKEEFRGVVKGVLSELFQVKEMVNGRLC
jgi:hypothetical protein